MAVNLPVNKLLRTQRADSELGAGSLSASGETVKPDRETSFITGESWPGLGSLDSSCPGKLGLLFSDLLLALGERAAHFSFSHKWLFWA
jgi:hypothetical protein